MYKLMISFPNEDLQICSRPKEYLLTDELEVCNVISMLSHLQPVITLFQLPVLTADDVLKEFELKEI